MLRLKIAFVLLLSALTLGACSTETPVSAMPAGLDSLVSNTIFEPQVTFLKDGTLLMTWRERTESGSDIFAAARTSDGTFGQPVRVNDEADTVESYAHDGMRASIAVGSGASIAIAWADARAQIRAAISSDGGLSFAPAVRLDQAGKPAYRGFPAISFDA
ncbi:MAG: exo-alpha-sialidase, partial [Proteobacteria bacterium]|nr:exo-alpha-sialidase [Pseudomonadota bacterium]